MISPIIYLVFRLILLYALTAIIVRILWYCSILDSVLKLYPKVANKLSFYCKLTVLSSAPQKTFQSSTGYGPCPQILIKTCSHHPNVSHMHRLDPNSGALLYMAR